MTSSYLYLRYFDHIYSLFQNIILLSENHEIFALFSTFIPISLPNSLGWDFQNCWVTVGAGAYHLAPDFNVVFLSGVGRPCSWTNVRAAALL
jgi:hypothetical protein